MSFSIKISAIPVAQPIGQFFVGVIKSSDLLKISSADMRRIAGDLDAYVGIQRKLSADRVKEIGAFVNSIDATFPTSIVLSVSGSCADFDANEKTLTLFEGEDETTGEIIRKEEIANILDGQHRIEGLRDFRGDHFDLAVSIFVDADIADQAFIFATVNLAQTKVNKSLVYDLLDYAKARSPQKSCHDIAVALDSFEGSPLRGLIKRLGTATPGRTGETLAQATFVAALLTLVSSKPQEDRNRLAKGKSVPTEDYKRTPFRNLWVQERDTDIAKILIGYFEAVRRRWPEAWASRERGDILPRTNGFRAFMRFLKIVYLNAYPSEPRDPILDASFCEKILQRCTLNDNDFNIQNFPPGSSGEKRLFERLRRDTGL
jgi:DGQHR domain-containing protein